MRKKRFHSSISSFLRMVITGQVLIQTLCGCAWMKDQFKSGKDKESLDLNVEKYPSSAAAMEELIEGWNEMIDQIDHYNPNRDNLDGKAFKLKVKMEGDWDLKIYPDKAFHVTPYKDNKNLFSATIKNSKSLYDQTGGIVKRAFIQAEIRKRGGNRGRIDLSPRLSCLFKVTFFQKNGQPLDFAKIDKGHHYQIIISNPKAARVISKDKEAITIDRNENDWEDVRISIRLEDKKTKEEYVSPSTSIPPCLLPSTSAEGEKGKIQEEHRPLLIPRTPGQCITHVSEGKSWEYDKRPQMTVEEIYTNSCPLKVRCRIHARFGLVKKGKIVYFKKQTQEISFPPEQAVTVKNSYDFTQTKQIKDFDTKIYSTSRFDQGSFTNGVTVKRPSDFLECAWESGPIK